MKIYNQAKTEILENPDLTLGHLQEDTITHHHDKIEAVEEQGHWKTITEYPNGGKDVEWVVDVAGVEGHDAYDEIENIYVYIPYTKQELDKINAEKRITELKRLLNETDYLAIKYAEGWISEQDYAPTKALRQSYRDEINELEEALK